MSNITNLRKRLDHTSARNGSFYLRTYKRFDVWEEFVVTHEKGEGLFQYINGYLLDDAFNRVTAITGGDIRTETVVDFVQDGDGNWTPQTVKRNANPSPKHFELVTNSSGRPGLKSSGFPGSKIDSQIIVESAPTKDYVPTLQWVNFGRIQDASVAFEPVNDDPDQDGRDMTKLYNLQISFVLQQTSNEELSMVPELARPRETDFQGNALYPNGHAIYVAGSKTSTADVNTSASSSSRDVPAPAGSVLADPNGLVFTGAILKPGIELNIGSDASMTTIETQATLDVSALGSLDTDAVIQMSVD